MSHLSFGPAKPGDAFRLSILFQTVYIETYADQGITVEFANFIGRRFAPAYLESIILENPDRFVIAYFDDNPIGAAEVLFVSECPIRKIAVPELSKLYILTQFMGQGIGYRLLQQAEKLVIDQGFQEFFLEVYTKNPHAISFYERQGYQNIGEVDFPMEENTYQNFVMTKSLNTLKI